MSQDSTSQVPGLRNQDVAKVVAKTDSEDFLVNHKYANWQIDK